MPMRADMKDIMTAAYYGTSVAEVRGRREQQGATSDAPAGAGAPAEESATVASS
jgi:acetaldehyde dehydrogenase/alcohol dehydrogenase